MNTDMKQTNLYDRVKKLLVSDKWSDCCFSVSDKKFRVHKLILGISSPVFEAMFYGPLSSENDVVITDIEPAIFQLVLNYIYTDKVEISSIEEAFELLYASKKYILDPLSNMCTAYIKANISADNAVEVLNYPEYLHDKQLTSFAQKIFCEHATYLFKENKDIISSSCMKVILESECINISEAELIKHVLDWTRKYCKQIEVPDTHENRRGILVNNGLFDLLRFHMLSLEDFQNIAENSYNILTPTEIESIKMAIEGKAVEDKFIYKPRYPLKLQWGLCHRNCLRSVAPINIDSINSILHSRIRANKSVFITSLCVPTRMAPVLYFHNNMPKSYSEQLSVSIVSESDNSTVKCTNFINTVEYDFYVDIELSEPCFIKKDEWYKIKFMWPQNRLHTYLYVVQLRETTVKNKNKIAFEFDDLSTSSMGSFLEGFKYCL